MARCLSSRCGSIADGFALLAAIPCRRYNFQRFSNHPVRRFLAPPETG